jgi:aminoglycoside 2'-N-acetyltransferase I
MQLELKAAADLSAAERQALAQLSAAVYPPEVLRTSPGRFLEWASAQSSVLAWTAEQELVAHVGMLVRSGMLDGSPVRIGGIGGVKTHPHARGQGYASAALRSAAQALRDRHQVAFSLLVCQAHLLPFYQKLGWLPFAGRLMVEQPGGSIEFTVNHPMVLPGLQPAPRQGVIDLAGLPW